VFHASREGRAAEVVGWANAVAAVAIAGGLMVVGWERWGTGAAWVGLVMGVFAFALLRLSLAHRVTVWGAAVLGTGTSAAGAGSLAWVFGHAIEHPAAPPVAAGVAALVVGLPAAIAYARIARRRSDDVPDSLLEPVSLNRRSAPHSQ